MFISLYKCRSPSGGSLSVTQECRFLFNSYVGAVLVQHGAETVQNWITNLVRPSKDDRDRDRMVEPDPAGYNNIPPPPKRAKNESVYVNTSLGQLQTSVVPPRFLSSLPPFPSASAANYTAPPSSSGRTTPGPSSPPSSIRSFSVAPTSGPGSGPAVRSNTPQFLPMFNQAAVQRKVHVEYQTTFHGPPHAGKWHAVCIGETQEP